MRKVMIAAAALALLATPAISAIQNTKHDLSSQGGATIRSGNQDEICVFCHTPHKAQTGLLAPLWNRSHLGKTYVVADLYNSATLDSDTAPTAVLAAVNASDAKLCMSCHDGASLAGGLLNPANAAGAQPGAFNGGVTVVGTDATIGGGVELKNDHPIGMPYDGVQTDDAAGFNASGGVSPNKTVGGSLKLFTANNVMWCSSCHNVHDDTNSPFLRATNVGSALCTTCHKK